MLLTPKKRQEALQYMTFHDTKHGLLQAKNLSFVSQKTVFRVVKGNLLKAKKPFFIAHFICFPHYNIGLQAFRIARIILKNFILRHLIFQKSRHRGVKENHFASTNGIFTYIM